MMKADAAVFMAGALQYLVSEIMEMAGEKTGKTKRIKPHHIMSAVREDEEFNKLMAYTYVSEGGYKKVVHKQLFPKNKMEDSGDHPAATQEI